MNRDDEDMVKAFKSILLDMGFKVNTDGMRRTPERFLKYLQEFNQSFKAETVLGTVFSSEGHHNMVIQSNIPFRMMCEHHLLPALGRAALGYVPGASVVGLSKIARLVDAVGTEKPSLQEYICDRIAILFNQVVKPRGVIVIIKAEHGCMACRGAKVPGVQTITSTVSGIFRDVPHARSEFFSLVDWA